MTLGFLSPWISGSTHVRRVESAHSKCSHRMALISHEKLEVLFGDDGSSEMAKYRLELEIPGSYSKNLRKKTIATMKQQADFKGFRKGTIPPFIYKDIDGFVLQDSISDMISEACGELGLKPIKGDAAEPEMDMDDIKSRWKVGTDLRFTCSLPLEIQSEFDIDAPLDGADQGIQDAVKELREADAAIEAELNASNVDESDIAEAERALQALVDAGKEKE